MRPEAKTLHSILMQTNERSLLAWRKEDKEASSRAAELGAPLKKGITLYEELQYMYYT